MAQLLEYATFLMSLLAVSSPTTPLGTGFSEKYHVSPLSSQCKNVVSMLRPWVMHFNLICFISLRCKLLPGRTEIAMCTRSLIRRNGFRTVYFQTSCQTVNCKLK